MCTLPRVDLISTGRVKFYSSPADVSLKTITIVGVLFWKSKAADFESEGDVIIFFSGGSVNSLK